MQTLARTTDTADNDPPQEDPEHYRHVFDQAANFLRLTDSELATRAFTSRNTINSKRKGQTPVRRKDLFMLASALTVPIEVFFQSSIGEAMAFVLENTSFDKETAQFR